MIVKEIGKKELKTCTPEVYTDMLKKLRKEHDKLVKGMFEFIDAQGGWFEFSFRFFKGEPLRTIKIVHGEICELPLGIVRHLNNTAKKVRSYAGQANSTGAVELLKKGLPPTSVQRISRVRFTPVDYL